MTYAADLSADLGFGRAMPPAFWRWCRRHGLEPASPSAPFAFRPDDVRAALERAKR